MSIVAIVFVYSPREEEGAGRLFERARSSLLVLPALRVFD
jgi:hypothetical protein